ncbi:hypothetical protein [Pseudoduganella chitinolytica]|uniref:Uncharacterized protein n=1 Tax=Pseudoduganella chitinolytica TaxID=34070 RepID=A0ABY8BFF9_9BURK|nr:hypothetical protein [Pseudoduganella chitinolytica]WEF34634.1 hypothetical protein PX653_07695 [Pseudoduganella chitinolytica]
MTKHKASSRLRRLSNTQQYMYAHCSAALQFPKDTSVELPASVPVDDLIEHFIAEAQDFRIYAEKNQTYPTTS